VPTRRRRDAMSEAWMVLRYGNEAFRQDGGGVGLRPATVRES
jgi:hypothetical protein